MDKFDVSLILPCYNEKETILNSIDRIIKVLDVTGFTWEIIFVDDFSKDDTQSLIKKILVKYPKHNLRAFFHSENFGRGQTVMDGFFKAYGKIIGFLDADLEVGEWYLPKFIQSIEQGADMVVAWRIYDFNLNSIFRWFASKSYTLIRKIVIGLPYKDTEAGYKFFNRRKILPIIKDCRFQDWFWDTEIMARVHDRGLKVVEVPVAFVKRTDKNSTVKLLPDSLKYLKDLISFKIKPNK